MIPVLYASNETMFENEGLGRLGDAISCSVREVRNGEYELSMRYPVDGYLFGEIQHSRFVKAKPFDNGNPQPFEIYKISKPINGIVSVYGRHLSYRLSLIPVMPFSAVGANAFMQALPTYAAETCPFSFWTDITSTREYNQTVPSSIRNRLGGEQGSALQMFGGEFEWDKWSVKLHNHRGANNGVVIAYGKNLIDLTQEESIESTYTGVAPYWEGDGVVVTLPEKVLHSAAAANYPYQRTIPLDMSANFIDQPTEQELRDAANAYMVQNNIGVPDVSLSVDFVPLAQTENYKDVAPLEHVRLCDTVTVKFDKLGVAATAKVVETRYDVLAEKYSLVKIGGTVHNLTDIIVDQSKAIEEIKEDNAETAWEEALEHAMELITGGLGGHVVINTNDAGQPNEILIMDTADKATAQNVLRMNMNGIAFSQSGYGGPWTSAWTIDGRFLAGNITVEDLVANVIQSGNFDSRNFDPLNPTEGFRIDLNTGEIICPRLTINIANVSGLEDSLAEKTGDIGDLNDAYDDLSDQVAQNTAFRNDGRAFFRFDDDGVHVGRQGNEFETLTSNDRFAIVQNGREIAWFDSKGLDTSTVKLSDALVMPPLQLTNYDHGWLITKG